MDETTYTLYEHIFPNGKRYVGVTKQNVNARWKNGFGYCTQTKVYEAINKFGWDNIEHIVLEKNLTEEEAHNLERERIIEFDTVENGYNTWVGGITTSGEKLYEYNGEFLTASELGDKYGADGVDGHCITNRIRRGYDVKTAVETPNIKREDNHFFNGKCYSTSEIVNMANIELTNQDVQTRIYYGWDLDRILNQPKGKKLVKSGTKEPTYEYNGKLYNTYQLSQLSPYDLTSANIYNRINEHHWSVERAINTPKVNRNIKLEYNGKEYSTKEIAELNPDPRVTHHTVTDRLKGGWSVEDIIKIPIGFTRKQFYNNNK